MMRTFLLLAHQQWTLGTAPSPAIALCSPASIGRRYLARRSWRRPPPVRSGAVRLPASGLSALPRELFDGL